jgi:hypothetical protein
VDRIFALKNKCESPDKFFVNLLDYYLGAAGGEVLTEFITERGQPPSTHPTFLPPNLHITSMKVAFYTK